MIESTTLIGVLVGFTLLGIIIGRMINGGTGYCQLLMDNHILENTELNVSTIQQGLSLSDDIIKLDDNMIIDDLIKKDSEMFIV